MRACRAGQLGTRFAGCIAWRLVGLSRFLLLSQEVGTLAEGGEDDGESGDRVAGPRTSESLTGWQRKREVSLHWSVACSAAIAHNHAHSDSTRLTRQRKVGSCMRGGACATCTFSGEMISVTELMVLTT